MALVIPFFMPHRGCPHRCLFCDQVAISGAGPLPESTVARELDRVIECWLGRRGIEREVQVAFYGGSFTCLPLPFQRRLLETVGPYIDSGEVDSIRVSTRPDCIDRETCEFLRYHRVQTVELGVQSLDDAVLRGARRGHDRASSFRAAELLQEAGFDLGLQLMVGLPGESTGSFLRGIRAAAAVRPDFVRLYPVVVMKRSGLHRLAEETGWRPLTLNRAVALTRRARELLTSDSVKVIRMGLQPSPELQRAVVAGPYHPAFGELVISRDWFRRTRSLLAAAGAGRELVVTISDRDYSAFVGPGRINLERLRQLFPDRRLAVEADSSRQRFTMHHAVC